MGFIFLFAVTLSFGSSKLAPAGIVLFRETRSLAKATLDRQLMPSLSFIAFSPFKSNSDVPIPTALASEAPNRTAELLLNTTQTAHRPQLEQNPPRNISKARKNQNGPPSSLAPDNTAR